MRLFQKSLIGTPPQPLRELTLPSPCPTPLSGEDSLKNREEEGYLQNLPSTLRSGFYHFPLIWIPSLGSLTGTWLALKAFHGINFKPSWQPVKGEIFLERPRSLCCRRLWLSAVPPAQSSCKRKDSQERRYSQRRIPEERSF